MKIMEIQQKLKLILQLTGLSQDKLAKEIGVTFASLNR
jgi:transcriptional regulator with XRE-family HTH domain